MGRGGGWTKQERMKVVRVFLRNPENIDTKTQDMANLKFVQYVEALSSQADSIGNRPWLV